MMNSTALTNVVVSNEPSSLRNFSRLSDARLQRRVVEVHVLAARVGRGDAAGLRRGVPVVDRAVVLDAGVGAGPGGLGDVFPQLLGVDGLDDLVVRTGAEPELATGLDGPHELVVDADRVVGVLVLDRRDVGAAEVHVVAGIAEDADLVLLAAPWCATNSSMSGWSTSRTTILAARRVAPPDLMVPAGRVGAAHEGDRTGSRATRGAEQLLGRTDAGQVEAGTGAALEDQALLLVPVEDRVHRVIHREDEAGADLLGAGRADVEPHRAVEAEHLVQQHVGQLVLEDRGLRSRWRSSRCRGRPACR